MKTNNRIAAQDTRETRTVVLAECDLPDYREWLADNDFDLLSCSERADGHFNVTFAIND